jgi:hypothetical protein
MRNGALAVEFSGAAFFALFAKGADFGFILEVPRHQNPRHPRRLFCRDSGKEMIPN